MSERLPIVDLSSISLQNLYCSTIKHKNKAYDTKFQLEFQFEISTFIKIHLLLFLKMESFSLYLMSITMLLFNGIGAKRADVSLNDKR